MKFSRHPLVLSSVLAVVLLGVGAMGGAAYVYTHQGLVRSWVQAAKALVREPPPPPLIATNLYNLRIQELAGPFEGKDGGIASVRDHVLLATRTGAFWSIEPKTGEMQPLDFRAPVDVETFNAAAAGVVGARPLNFGLKDIEVRQAESAFTLFVSFHHWDADRRCLTMRVASTELPYDAMAADFVAESHYAWTPLFETQPCLYENVVTGNLHGAQQSGGRLALLDDERLLLSTGDYFYDGLTSESYPQALDNSYGKIIAISLNGNAATIFSSGHRNPQGLLVTSDGDVFSTEHGPRGGDELNRIVEGSDYGWPRVTYGTNMEAMEWPLNPYPGEHHGFAGPVFAWVPSVGISNLISVTSSAFELWKGDLLVASLTGRRLFRVKLVGRSAVIVEPMEIGHRVRDIIEAPDGSVVLKTDDNLLMFLRPVETSRRDPSLSSEPDSARGQLLAAQCSGCHSFDRQQSDGIGPSLFGIVGREIAAIEDYEYSPALRALSGEWSPDRLRKFVADPNSVAPGTTMIFQPGYSDLDMDDLLSYLATSE